MDALFTCLGLVLGLFVLAAPVVAVLALVRTRALGRELSELRRELMALRRSLRTPPAAQDVAGSSPAAPPVPAGKSAEVASELARARTGAPPPLEDAAATAAPARPLPSAQVVPPVVTAQARPAPRARAASIDWERWLGVRGFAVVGGILLALAAIYFFQHAFTHGWIPPGARVACGLGAGAAGIVAAARLRQRAFGWAPSALEGAGIVALYASLWAAQQRYFLVGPALAFPGMMLVTALACFLALRHGSLFSALLGLAGGFATPLLLAQGHERPVPLFGYVLLLDLGLLFVARRRRWTQLGLLALVATQVLLGGWIFLRGGAPWPGLGFAAAFALVFAFSGLQGGPRGRALALATQALGLLAPFFFALHYAQALDLGRHFGWTGAYLALLVTAATVIARRPDAGWLAGAAVVASVAVAGTWFQALAPAERGAAASELVLAGLALTALSHAFAEWERLRAVRLDARAAALVASLAWSALLLLAEALPSEPSFGFWALLGGVAGLAALVLRQALLLEQAKLALASGITLGLTLARLAAREPFYSFGPPDRLVLALLPMLAGAFLLFLVPRLSRVLDRRAVQTAGVLGLTFALATLVHGQPRLAEPYPWLSGLFAFLLVALILEAAARSASSGWVVAAVVVGCILGQQAHINVLWRSHGSWEQQPWRTLASLWFVPAGATLLAVRSLPALDRRNLPSAALTCLTLVLLVPFVQAVEFAVWREHIRVPSEAFTILLLALPQATAVLLLARRGASFSTRSWFAASALALAALGLADLLGRTPWTVGQGAPLLTANEWAVGLALGACAWSALGRRYGLEPPRHAAAVAGALSVLILLARVLVREAYPAQGLFAPWVAYEHLVPAAALLGALVFLPPTDGGLVQRARRVVLASGVLGLVFLWLNWTIESAFTEGESLTLFAVQSHARDLTTSLVWGVFGMALLLLGTWRRVASLRWASLAVLLLSIAKVFLHDLAHLDGLWRVASLAGLALSLIAVSLFYQRFVFGKSGARATGSAPGE